MLIGPSTLHFTCKNALNEWDDKVFSYDLRKQKALDEYKIPKHLGINFRFARTLLWRESLLIFTEHVSVFKLDGLNQRCAQV